MKKYYTGVAAVLIAIAAAAFTTPKVTNVSFVYDPPSMGDYSRSSVQDKNNWVPGTESCDDTQNKACELTVLSSDTKSGGTQLGNSVSIVADEGNISGEFFVSNASSHVQTIDNQQ